jgi:HNH endonuclease
MTTKLDDMALAFLHTADVSNDSFPRISLVPKPDKSAEVAELFEDSADVPDAPRSQMDNRWSHVLGRRVYDHDFVSKTRVPSTILIWSAVGDKRSSEHPEDEAGDASWYELEDRLAYLQARVPKGSYLETDFTWAKWRSMLDAFEWKCAYCKDTDELGQDHVIPISDGGADLMENVLPACKACNRRKGHMAMADWLASHCPIGTIARIEEGRKKCRL